MIVWPDSVGGDTCRRVGRAGAILATAGGVLIATLVAGTGTVRAALDRISSFLSLHGEPEPASANVLSEHEIETLDAMTPQAQAELLLERSINHYQGANEQIAARVARLAREHHTRRAVEQPVHDRHQLRRSPRASRRRRGGHRGPESREVGGDHRSAGAVAARGEQGPRANALWDIGLLGSRGIDPTRRADPARLDPRR